MGPGFNSGLGGIGNTGADRLSDVADLKLGKMVQLVYRWYQGDIFTLSGRLSRYDSDHWQMFGVHEGLVHPKVNVILEDRDRNLWLGTRFASQGGAIRYDKNS